MATILFFSERDIPARFLGERKLPTSMRYFGNEQKLKKKDALVGKVSVLQPERGIRVN